MLDRGSGSSFFRDIHITSGWYIHFHKASKIGQQEHLAKFSHSRLIKQLLVMPSRSYDFKKMLQLSLNMLVKYVQS